jgi:hypothetical protein
MKPDRIRAIGGSMKRFMDWIDAFIGKHHKCENNMRLVSKTYHTDGWGQKTLIGMEARCIFCDHVESWSREP